MTEADEQEFLELGQQTLPIMQRIEMDLRSLRFTKAQIIDKWERGIWNDLAYVDAALQYDGLDKPLDIDNFIFNWRGVLDMDTGKCKVLKAIAALEDKGIVEMPMTQLALNFVEAAG